MPSRVAAVLLAIGAMALPASAQDEVPLSALREGHWVVLSGELTGLDAFTVDEVELTVRLPIKASNVWQVEDAILRSWLETFE